MRFKNGFWVLGAWVFSSLTMTTVSQAQANTAVLDAFLINTQKACPKQWQDLQSDIELNPNVLDIWQGDLTDKAQFVQFANEHLTNSDGQLLIDNYSDVVTIMTECAAQRLTYYKTIREHIGAMIGGMVSNFTSQTAFSQNSIASGVDYTALVDGTTQVQTEQQWEPENLAIGRPTSQSGTTSEELALADPNDDFTEDEYGEMAKRSGYATKAVDNSTNGQLAAGSVTYTGFQNQPFWQIELDTICEIEAITIYNRTDDCCKDRLSNFRILISDKPITKRWLTDASHDVVVKNGSDYQSEFAATHQESKTYSFPSGTIGRYVRIQLVGNNTVLSLAEVEIIGHAIRTEL